MGEVASAKAPAPRRLMLLLDSEAISALAHGPRDRRDRVRDLIVEAHKRARPVAAVAAVVAEVVRGRRADAAVFAIIRTNRIEVRPIDARVGVRAGELLGHVHAGSELAIDAFSVAVADLAGGGVIATTDVGDLERLANHATGVEIADING